MRPRLIAGIIVFFVFASAVLVAVLFGPGLVLSGVTSGGKQFLKNKETSTSNVIALENLHLGTVRWQIPGDKAASTQIQAYAGATSVFPGQKLAFYVSTQKEGTSYSVSIYRMGWYGGEGARLMKLQYGLFAHAQGYYDSIARSLIGCDLCRVNLGTGLVEANWQPSYSLVIPSDWTTGVYLAKFTDVHGMQTYAPFDVRGNSYSQYIVVTSDTTYAAYNDWGGYSLYNAVDSVNLAEKAKLPRAIKVSFDRPYDGARGSGQVLQFEINAIRWMERQGYDLSYISDIDLHVYPAQLLQHRAYLSLGHDEYWTKEMRDGVEFARDHGVSLAFLGANAAYWQMRFEPDNVGTPNRTVVSYKVLTSNHDLSLDPFYGRDNSRVTTLWRDPVLARPENALVGIMYSNLTHQQLGFPWQLDSGAKTSLLDGTGLQPHRLYGCGVVGYEWDHIFANGATPEGLHVLGRSNTKDNENKPDFSNTTFYVASSGALVFATGSIYWTSALDSYRLYTDNLCINQNLVVPDMQKLMANVMDALVKPHF